MAAEKHTKRLRFDAEPHHQLVYADGKEPVRGGETFQVDDDTFKRLLAAPHVPVSDATPTPEAKPARGAAHQNEKEE